MNPLEEMRRRRLLSPYGEFEEAQPREVDYVGPIEATIHQPDSREYYREVMGRMPTRENYKPSLARKIGGGILGGLVGAGQGGAAGAQTAQGIINAPYNRAMGDWKSEEQRAKALYDIDTGEATRAREIANQEFEKGIKVADIGIKQGAIDVNRERVSKMPTPQQTMELKQAEFDADMAKAERGDEEAMSRLLETQEGLTERNALQLQNARDIAKMNNDAAWKRAEAANASRERAASERGKTANKVSPSQQTAASGEAFSRILRNPDTSNYIKVDPKTNKPVRIMSPKELEDKFDLSPNDAQELYKSLQDLYDSMLNEVMSTSGIEPEYNEEENDDWLEIDEFQEAQ